jgi:HSP20 family protein
MEDQLMNLVGSTPFHDMTPFLDTTLFHDRMNRLFESTLHRLPEKGDGTSTWIPAADICETDDKLVVTADLPGADPNEFVVRVENNVLSIRGDRHFERTVENEKLHRVERLYGGFERSFPLATPVEADKIQATYQDGVLRICLPKADIAKPKRVQVGKGQLIPFRSRSVASASRA